MFSDTSMHPAGNYSYPFQMQLPNSLPSSFEGAHGNVRYYIKCAIDRPWKFDHKTKRVFTVISQLDLNRVPDALVSYPSTIWPLKISQTCMQYHDGYIYSWGEGILVSFIIIWLFYQLSIIKPTATFWVRYCESFLEINSLLSFLILRYQSFSYNHELFYECFFYYICLFLNE